jgi:hypothetical protein
MFELTAERLGRIRRALARLQAPQTRLVSFDFFSDAEIDALRAEALAQDFRKAQAEIKHRGRAVFQDFDVCFPAPRVGSLDAVATQLETGLYTASQSLSRPVFAAPFELADFAIQHYPRGARGIGIHRDGLRYRHIVVIITLAGVSRLFACDDRQGRNKRRIDDRPGRVVLLSAAGFDGREGEDARPLHGVDLVEDGRLSLGFRAAPEAPQATQ